MAFSDLFCHRYATSQEAVDTCQSLAHGEGFSVRIRTSKANTVYIVCSKEGKPEHRSIEPKKRNRNSERCHCGWRVVLFFNANASSNLKWEFRAGKSMTHNHPLAFPPPHHLSPTASITPTLPSSLRVSPKVMSATPRGGFLLHQSTFHPYAMPQQRDFAPLPIKRHWSDERLPSIHELLNPVSSPSSSSSPYRAPVTSRFAQLSYSPVSLDSQ